LQEYSVNYNGTIGGKAHRLSWAQVRVALPEPSQCASVPVLGLMSGRARQFLLHPELSIKDLRGMLEPPKAGKMLVSSDSEGDINHHRPAGCSPPLHLDPGLGVHLHRWNACP
jgi:hypothetical protein